MEFLEVPLFDDDFYKLLVRFGINFLFLVFSVVFGIYAPNNKKSNYIFTYILMSLTVFFICFTLKKMQLGLGMALGLFAIFAIIRYRTGSIPIKEMTYLFIVIGLSVINALSNKQMSYVELAFTNLSILAVAYWLEKVLYTAKQKVLSQSVIYDRLELLGPEHQDQLKADIEKRTGLNVDRIEIGKIDLSNQTVTVKVYYWQSDHNQSDCDDEDSSL